MTALPGAISGNLGGMPMRLKTIILAAACAFSLLSVLPQAAMAQGAPPVTVRTIDPPNDAMPAPGVSFIRFGNHQIEVSGPVEVTVAQPGNAKSASLLILPDGAPALPADLFDPTPLPGGGVGYVLKTQDRVTVIYAAKVNTTQIPGQYLSLIDQAADLPQTKLGVLRKGEVVMSVPYRYRKPIRMTDDLSITGLFGTHVLATKGETGFDAGEYGGGAVHRHLLCFFNTSHSNPYAAPDCFVKFPSPDGTFGLAEVSVATNLPTAFEMSRYEVTGVKAPPIATEGVSIDHDFHLDLVVGWWSDRGLELTWRSEGKTLQTQTVPADKDGFVRIHIKGGSINLHGDPYEHVKTIAEFVPDADAPKP